MFKAIIYSLFSLFFIACGGGGSESTTTSITTNENPIQDNSDNVIDTIKTPSDTNSTTDIPHDVDTNIDKSPDEVTINTTETSTNNHTNTEELIQESNKENIVTSQSSNQAPIIQANVLLQVIEGDNNIYTITVSDPDNDTIEVLWTDENNQTLSTNNHIELSLFNLGMHSLNIKATDSNNLSTNHSLSIIVLKSLSHIKTMQTGQDQMYTLNDDGDLKNGMERLFKNDISNQVVIDLNRGLIWEDSNNNEGFLSGYTYDQAIERCQNLDLANLIWRLPSISELMTGINRQSNSINSYESLFVHTANASTQDDYPYLSSSLVENNISLAYALDSLGLMSTVNKSDAYITRCVSQANRVETLDYNLTRDVTKEIVINHNFALSYQDDINVTTKQFTWEEALLYCDNLTLNGETHWRLPNERELLSMFNTTNHFTKPYSSFIHYSGNPIYWTSTTIGREHSLVDIYTYKNQAITIDSNNSEVFTLKKENNASVRCVKDLNL